jgi:hypothetical protein
MITRAVMPRTSDRGVGFASSTSTSVDAAESDAAWSFKVRKTAAWDSVEYLQRASREVTFLHAGLPSGAEGIRTDGHRGFRPSRFVAALSTSEPNLTNNKTRKLEFLMAEARDQGIDIVLTQGATQSNHARQTAAFAARMGMGCHILLEDRTGKTDRDYTQNGNVLLGAAAGRGPLGGYPEGPAHVTLTEIHPQRPAVSARPFVTPKRPKMNHAAEPMNEDSPRQAVAGFSLVQFLPGHAPQFRVLEPVENTGDRRGKTGAALTSGGVRDGHRLGRMSLLTDPER